MFQSSPIILQSSPHLVEVRERIRIGGSPISADLFTHYFWQVYDTLKANLEPGESMPPYFKFLTLLAFKVGFVSALLVLSAIMTLDYEVILDTSLSTQTSNWVELFTPAKKCLIAGTANRYRLLNSESER